MNKKTREAVYQKYNGHCAYCGKLIEYKDMQVDHIRPHREWLDAIVEGENIDSLSNLNPSCKRCNHYKRSLNLEKFRNYIKTLHERISKDYIVKVGLDYGIVNITPFDGKFYYEKIESEDKK